MRILYLLSPDSVHSHDYGVDFLLYGLFTVLGFDNVYDWPEKDSLHATEPERRIKCGLCEDALYDSDQEWPRKLYDIVLEQLMEMCDIAILATQPGDRSALMYSTHFARSWSPNKPIIAIDQSDSVAGALNNCSMSAHTQYYRAIAGRPLAAYFKRELPIGEHWALPLPLSYPAARVPSPFPSKDIRVFYHAAQHNEDEGPGIPRSQIVRDLRLRCDGADVELYSVPKDRLTPIEYHRRMAQSLIGVSWNGFPYIQNWDCSRFWEQFAFGMCQVAETPRIRIPHAPQHGVHCLYVSSVDEVGPAVEYLLREPQRTLAIASAGHAHFLQYHSSEARAMYLLQMIQQIC